MKLFTLSLFALGAILTSNTFAATGTGHAQAQLTNPLIVYETATIDFGTISVDPAAGPQTISMNNLGSVTCPASYACSGTPAIGTVTAAGANNTMVHADITGQTAILSDGSGNTITFDPEFTDGGDTYSALTHPSIGARSFYIMGEIYLNGDEPGGTYNSSNAGGSGYVVTVNY